MIPREKKFRCEYCGRFMSIRGAELSYPAPMHSTCANKIPDPPKISICNLVDIFPYGGAE